MRVLKIADMLKHDSTIQYNQDYYEEKKEAKEGEEKQIAGLSVPSNIDISKFIKTDEDKIIKSISPLAVYNYQISYHDYIQLAYLAKNATGKVFIINVIYDAVYEGDEKIVEFIKNNISFYDDKKYVDNKSREMINKMLFNTLPTFYSDNTITFKDDNTFALKCVVGDGVYENDTEFYFDAPIMNCIKFTEVYVKEAILNNHDIVLCNIHGANDTKMDLFKVAKVLDIINIAPLNEEQTAIAIMLKVADKDDKESFILFVCSYVNDKIKSKLNSTIDEVTNMYANNEDYWLAEFFYSAEVGEEGYVIYSAKNNKIKYTTFMFNKECVDQIESLLNA